MALRTVSLRDRVPDADEVVLGAGAQALALGDVAEDEPAVGVGGDGEGEEGEGDGEAAAATTGRVAGEGGEQGGMSAKRREGSVSRPRSTILRSHVGTFAPGGSGRCGRGRSLRASALMSSPGNGRSAVEALVQADAEAELVGERGAGGAAELLGGAVGGGAGEGAGAGEAGVEVDEHAGAQGLAVWRRDVGVAVLREGEAEVDDADAAVVVDEHVVGLEVAVDEAVLVGGGEALAGLAEHGEDLAPGPGFEVQPDRERDALDELHGDEDVVLVGADVVDRDDVGVREAGHRLGLAQEASAGDVLALAAEVRVEQLDGDLAVELGVPRGVDDAHAAGADQAQDVEPPDLDRRARASAGSGAGPRRGRPRGRGCGARRTWPWCGGAGGDRG
jgi:hypothetical protein